MLKYFSFNIDSSKLYCKETDSFISMETNDDDDDCCIIREIKINAILLDYIYEKQYISTSFIILPSINDPIKAPKGLALKINPIIDGDIPLDWAKGGKNGEIIDSEKQYIN